MLSKISSDCSRETKSQGMKMSRMNFVLSEHTYSFLTKSPLSHIENIGRYSSRSDINSYLREFWDRSALDTALLDVFVFVRFKALRRIQSISHTCEKMLRVKEIAALHQLVRWVCVSLLFLLSWLLFEWCRGQAAALHQPLQARNSKP